jgi:drug/metabolite transporter (DMT)-like permease
VRDTTRLPLSPERITYRRRATAVGFGAILLWALLALFTTGAVDWAGQPLPAFQLVAVTFGIAFLAALIRGLWQRARHGIAPFAAWRQRPAVWLLGAGGLFGYHFFYFTALGNAPAIDASLICFLWPLLIVLLSSFLPGERLTLVHAAGAAMGFAGATLILLDRSGWSLAFDARYWIGYVAAGACAVTWAGYSVLSRRFGDVPTDAVGGFCGATALLGLIAHLALETTQMPSATGWLAILALGVGPVGLAFFLWDHGVKHGDIKLLGVAAYAAPLFSTLALVVSGVARATPALAAACLLIVGGAALAAGLFSGRKTSPSGSR